MAAGHRLRFDLPAALLPTHTQLDLPLTVLHGRKPGPTLWLSAAVHGDELNGVEVIRRVVDRLDEPLRRGTLIAVPIVNVFGFIGQSRYLPDRRDLNRCFPGSARGSLAGRIAHLFMTEIVQRCTHGIDLHTASTDKTNLPQVRADLDDPETLRCAEVFGAPAMLHARTRDGSLRAAATKHGVAVLLFEGGEPQRFNGKVIDVAERGVLNVMHSLGMIRRINKRRVPPTVRIDESAWVRARRGGVLRLKVENGTWVEQGGALGTVSDPFGDDEVTVRAPFAGIVIGHSLNPVVHGGDAVAHVGRVAGPPMDLERSRSGWVGPEGEDAR